MQMMGVRFPAFSSWISSSLGPASRADMAARSARGVPRIVAFDPQ